MSEKVIRLKTAPAPKPVNKKKKLRKPSNLHAVLLITLTCVFMLFVIKKVLTFRISDIRISGSGYEEYRQDMDEICRTVENELYHKVDADALKESFGINGYIKIEECKKVFPNKLVVTIEKRYPLTQIEFAGMWLTVDGEGYVVDVLQNEKPDCLKITGVAVQSYTIGEKINFNSDYRRDGLLDIVNELNAYGLTSKIKEIMIYDYYDYRLLTESGNLIHLGIDDKLGEKLKWLQSDEIWELMLENPVTELDLRPESPVLRWPEVPESAEYSDEYSAEYEGEED